MLVKTYVQGSCGRLIAWPGRRSSRRLKNRIVNEAREDNPKAGNRWGMPPFNPSAGGAGAGFCGRFTLAGAAVLGKEVWNVAIRDSVRGKTILFYVIGHLKSEG